MELKVKALSPRLGDDIPMPFFASDGAAAMDLHACIDEPVTLAVGERAAFPTGFAIALPSSDYVALIYGRSGLGLKHGVTLTSCVGVIDSDYRGELMVALVNNGTEPYTVEVADRIAQLMVTPVLRPNLQWVPELDDTQRGGSGFGSTGK